MKPARDFVEEWLTANESKIGVAPSEMRRIDKYCEQFHAGYETNTHFIDVACWNHGDSLDVIILDKESGEMIFSEAGSCDGVDGLQQRLERMLETLAVANDTGEQVGAGQPEKRSESIDVPD